MWAQAPRPGTALMHHVPERALPARSTAARIVVAKPINEDIPERLIARDEQ